MSEASDALDEVVEQIGRPLDKTPWCKLPTDAEERKGTPVYSGFMCYFPLGIAEVAKHSRDCNEQHNPGEPMHWDRAKSKDERDAQARHLLDQALSGSLDEEIEHAKAGAWRAMANLEKLCEKREEIKC